MNLNIHVSFCIQEFNLLYYSLTSARIFFRGVESALAAAQTAAGVAVPADAPGAPATGFLHFISFSLVLSPNC